MAKAKPGFEKDLEQLEQIVSALEEGGLSLDDSLQRFEEGIKLARRCEKALSEAEKKIEILTKNADGELEAEPFDEDEEAEEPAPKAKKPARKSDPHDLPPDGEEEDGELLF
ncbi:MAG: exodeoxyribonuclease VII small subunit [Candidatus Hydrogenedens sp.]|nr:exodeoxyribonuclease VII small subunit [Candidatus Hydrogenedens sp.]